MQTTKVLHRLTLGLAWCVASIGAAAAPANLTIEVLASGKENIIRDDIGRSTFGSGVEHTNTQFRAAVATATPTREMVKSLNLGMMRFSNGTPGQLYFWENPSWGVNGAYNPSNLTHDELLLAISKDRLDMQPLFQVNTGQYMRSIGDLKYDKSDDDIVYLHKPRPNPAVDPMVIDPDGLNTLAGVAARWVEDNKRKAAIDSSKKVTYWEVGNEDWSMWTPREYAEIFNAYALRMKQADSNIKLLAQSFTSNSRPIQGKAPNDFHWLEHMIEGGIRTQDVYALSEHQYVSGGAHPAARSLEELRSLQLVDMFAAIDGEQRIHRLKDTLSAKGLPWKVWVTEYNEHPTSGEPVDFRQDLAHALVIADWTGLLLKRGVDKIFMTSLDHHPHFSLVQYVNWGGTIQAPYVSAPGHAFAKYATSFGEKMVRHNLVGAMPILPSPDAVGYDQVAIYPSIRESDPVFGGGPSMRVMVINRNQTEVANVTLKTQNRPIAGPAKKYYVAQLTADGVSHSNKTYHDLITWKTVVNGEPSNTAGITRQLPPKSATFFTIPLQ